MAFSKVDPSNMRFYPLDDMYYTLEIDAEDWEADQKRRKTQQELELSKQKTLDSKKREEDETKRKQEEEEKKKKALAAKAAANSSRELRSLLSDVKTNKKWQMAMPYEGQEELYESIDNVLTKLKDFQEHSYPFVNKVKVSDAPGYYDVIKKPMDLTTMQKKLRHGEYSSKSEFQADLNLIYSNCRIYNTDPGSRFILEHADALEKKSKELMKQVRSIDFTKERKVNESIEKEEAPATPTTVIPKTRKANKKASPSPDLSKDKEMTRSSTPPPTSVTSIPSHTPTVVSPPNTPSALLSPVPCLDITDVVAPENMESKTELFRCLTRQYRMHKVAYRTEQNSLKFEDRDALVRNPHKMGSFTVLSQYDEKAINNKHTNDATNDTDTTMKDATTPPWLCNIPFDMLDDETEQFSRLGAGFFPEITHFSDSVPNTFPPAFDPINHNRLNDHDINTGTMANPPMHSNPYFSALLQKAIANLLVNAGFSGVHDYVMDVLVDLVAGYFQKLGHILRVHMDSYGSYTCMEDIMNKALCEMGLNGILSLRDTTKGEGGEEEGARSDSPLSQNPLRGSIGGEISENDPMLIDNKYIKVETQEKEVAPATDTNYDSDTPLSHKAKAKRPPIKKSAQGTEAKSIVSPVADIPKSPIIKNEDDKKGSNNVTPTPPLTPPIVTTPTPTPPPSTAPTPPSATPTTPTTTPPASSKKRKAAATTKVTKKKK